MSGQKYIDYQYTSPYNAKQEARKRNERNKQRASQLIEELKTTIKQNKNRGAEKLAKEELEKAEQLLKKMTANVSSQDETQNNYIGVVEQEREIQRTCEALEAKIVEKTAKERMWNLPLKKMFELERKMECSGSTSGKSDNLLQRWKKDEFAACSTKLESLRESVESRSGNSETVFYELRNLDKEYNRLMQEANRLEEQSLERQMLVETVESALTSEEMGFEVKIRSEKTGDPYSTIILEAQGEGDEKIEMSFDLDKERPNSIDAFASGFADPGYSGGCDSAFDDLKEELGRRGLEIDTYIREDSLPPEEEEDEEYFHPSQVQGQAGSGNT